MQDFTFSNGVTVPKNDMILVIGGPHHRNPTVYSEPKEFKPFRFYDMKRDEGLPEESKKYQTVALSHEYLTFGLGKHAW
jgi:cytochrome P450